MIDALDDVYPIVDQPGPGVLRIRCALTDLKPGKPGLNAVTTVLPIGLALSFTKKAVTGAHTNVGQAALEAELLDSQTNERLAAVIDRQAGKKIQVAKGITKWGHVKEAFKFWAERLRFVLDEAH